MKTVTILVTLFLCVLSKKTIPSYIQLCSRNAADRNTCLQNSIRSIQPHLVNGIPELDVPSMDPHKIQEVVLFQGDRPESSGVMLKLALKNIVVAGLSKFRLLFLKEDLNRTTSRIGVLFPTLTYDSDFVGSLGPLQQNGRIDINIVGVECYASIKGQLIGPVDHQQLNFTAVDLALKVQDFQIQFKAPGLELIQQLAQQVFDNNKYELLELVRPYMESRVGDEVLKLGNRILKDLDYNDLFLKNK